MTCMEKVERATANLPQTTSAPLFTVSGGRVYLVGLLGEVTTVVQNQANQTKLVFNSAGAAANRDLCLTADLGNAAAETLLHLDPQAVGTGTSAGLKIVTGYAAAVFFAPLALPPGDIELSCAASNTGQVKWTALYLPFDPGAKVEAV